MNAFPPNRLPVGGSIDRTRPLRFSFDGRSFSGFDGDTLASALIANGVQVVGRSFKYHRPRGIYGAGSEEPNALVTHRSGAQAEPNTRATTLQLYDGLVAASQNRWPSLGFDVMAVGQLFSPLLAAGFYYKTFMWPAAFWEKVYEPLIRRAAGLGKLSELPDPDTYDLEHAFCDVLIIGAGPAGLSAAISVAHSGARVILVEEDWLLGGRALSEKHEIDGVGASRWAQEIGRELASLDNVRILTRTTVFGAYDGEYAAVERLTDHVAHSPVGRPRQRLWKIVAKRAVLATGAIERSLAFGNNDRTGVMMASALSVYINRFGVAPGRQVAIFTTTDSGWRLVDDLLTAKVPIAAVIDARATAPSTVVSRANAAGVPIHMNTVVTDVHGRTVRALDLRHASGKKHRISADTLAVSGGWNPTISLACHLGARPTWSDEIHSFMFDRPPPGWSIVGAAAGRFSFADAIIGGRMAGERIATELGFTVASLPAPKCSDDAVSSSPLWHIPGGRAKVFVDLQNDVTATDIAIAAREGFVSVEHLKRYTTLGMATDQGKLGQINGHALLAKHTNRSIGDVGTIAPRPPFVPVAIGVLAGHHRDEHFRPTRLTSSHRWAAEHGATFVDAAAWKRAQWFTQPSDSDWLASVSREVVATRSSVGVCDVSTLGKIDVQGPDAAAFLDRLYINMMSTLAVGKVRYGLMLREDGFVMDDGTVTRFGPEHFFVTTTTVNAGKVMQHIDFCRQVLWPDLDVQAVSATEQWAQFSIAGPNSRALLQALLPNVTLTNEAMPYMAAASIDWAGIPARLYRVSFSGELAYEIGVPARYGDSLIRALMQAGQSLGVVAYGVEALNVMRIEKGHVGGSELNGQTTATDLGLGRMMSTKKDFIGRVLAGRPALVDADRLRLVGLRSLQADAKFEAGAHLLATDARRIAANDEGHVTSTAYSPNLGGWIGLGLLKRGHERVGQRVCAYDPVRKRDTQVEVCSPIFLDPEGVRLRG